MTDDQKRYIRNHLHDSTTILSRALNAPIETVRQYQMQVEDEQWNQEYEARMRAIKRACRNRIGRCQRCVWLRDCGGGRYVCFFPRCPGDRKEKL